MLMALCVAIAAGLMAHGLGLQSPNPGSVAIPHERSHEPMGGIADSAGMGAQSELVQANDRVAAKDPEQGSAWREWDLSLRLTGAKRAVSVYLLEYGRDHPRIREVAQLARLSAPSDAGEAWSASVRASVNFDPNADPPSSTTQFFLGLLPDDTQQVGVRLGIGSAASMLEAAAPALLNANFVDGRPLEIRLVSPGGDPVAGVEIVPQCDANWWRDPNGWRLRGKSNQYGVIKFAEPLRDVRLLSDTPGWRVASSDERFVATDGVRDVLVEPEQVISGHVVDSAGNALSGVLVEVIGMPSLVSVSDSRGRFAIANSIPEGLTVALSCSLDGRGDTRGKIPVVSGIPGSMRDLVLAMGDLCKVSIRVVRDEDGSPVTKYALNLYGEVDSASDVFSGFHHDGVVVLRVRADQVTHFAVIPEEKDVKRSAKIVVGRDSGDVEVRLDKAMPIQILALDYAGRPIKDLQITLREARMDMEKRDAELRPVAHFSDSDRNWTDKDGLAVLWHGEGARQVQLLCAIGSETVFKQALQVHEGQHVVRLDMLGHVSAHVDHLSGGVDGVDVAHHHAEYRRVGGYAAQHRRVKVGHDGAVEPCVLPSGTYEVWLLGGKELLSDLGQLAVVDVDSGRDHHWRWQPPAKPCRVDLVFLGVSGPGVDAPDAVAVLTTVDAKGRRGSSFSVTVDRLSHRAKADLPLGRYCVEYTEFSDRSSWRMFLGSDLCNIDASGTVTVQLYSAAVDIEDVNGPIEGAGTYQVSERFSALEGAYPLQNKDGVLRSGMLAPGRYIIQLQDGREATVEIPWGSKASSRGVDTLRIRADFKKP